MHVQGSDVHEHPPHPTPSMQKMNVTFELEICTSSVLDLSLSRKHTSVGIFERPLGFSRSRHCASPNERNHMLGPGITSDAR